MGIPRKNRGRDWSEGRKGSNTTGFGLRKRIRLFKGAWINLSKQGGYLSIGGHGLTTDVSKNGVRETLSAPGPVLSRMKVPIRQQV
jgi:uncharacterized protein DUF4236